MSCENTSPVLDCQIAQPMGYDLCTTRTAEQYAEVALKLEPMGSFWCKQFTTVKANLHRAFGALLSGFDAALCNLYKESFGCQSVQLLAEFEQDYGLPDICMSSYPVDVVERQAMVCAAIQANSAQTNAELQAILQTALSCSSLTIQPLYDGTTYLGICVNGISTPAPAPVIHNSMGGWGILSGSATTTAPYGSSVGQPMTLNDPNYSTPNYCPVIYHSTMGGWTGGIGAVLLAGDFSKQNLLECLMKKHLPAHIAWTICV